MLPREALGAKKVKVDYFKGYFNRILENRHNSIPAKSVFGV